MDEASMTSKNESTAALAELAALLDVWGGEPTRWPPRVRLRIAELSATGPDAHELLAQARALDRLLDLARDAGADVPPAEVSALADRIVATAMSDMARVPEPAPPAPAADNVVSLTVRARPAVAHPLPGSRWHAAGLMAASLLAGIYIGGSLNLAPVLQEMAEVVGISTVIDPALSDDLGEEETP